MTRLPLNRRLIFVDIENINGRSIGSVQEANWCRCALNQWLAITDRDLIVVAADKSGVRHLHESWGTCQVLAAVGKSGADKQLIAAIAAEHNLVDRFKEIVIVSGDGIFVDSVLYLMSMGIPTTVCSYKSALNATLAACADNILILDKQTRTHKVSAARPLSIPKHITTHPIPKPGPVHTNTSTMKPSTTPVSAPVVRKVDPPSPCPTPPVISRSKISPISLTSLDQRSAIGERGIPTSPAQSTSQQLADRCSEFLKSCIGFVKKVCSVMAKATN